MARTINETPVDFTGESATPEIRFTLHPVTAEEPTVADRVYANVRVNTARDVDSMTTQYRLDVHVGDSDVSTFSAGDSADLRALLNKLLNHAIAEHNL